MDQTIPGGTPPQPATPTPQPPDERKHLVPFKLIAIGMIFFVGFLIIGVLWIILNKSKENALPENELTLKPRIIHVNSITAQKKIREPDQVLYVGLKYQNSKNPAINVTGFDVYSGYQPTYPKVEKGYTLEALDTGKKVLQEISFAVPSARVFEPGDIVSTPEIINEHEFNLVLIYKKEIAQIRIKDTSGKEIISKPLSDIKFRETEPNFDYIQYETEKKSSLDFTPTVLANDSKKLEIGFISGYTNAQDRFTKEEFNEKVREYSQHMLTYEPFKTRYSQLAFSPVYSTANLGCVYKGGTVIYCNEQTTAANMASSGAPYDKIVVLIKDPNKAGTAMINGPQAYLSAIPSDQNVGFVHELGHVLGLLDEYVYAPGEVPLKNVAPNYGTYHNCFIGQAAGSISAPFWDGFKGSDLIKGCNDSDWSRSSQTSVMKTLNSQSFNEVSQRILNSTLDEYAGKFVKKDPTPTPTSSPTPKASSQNTCGAKACVYYQGGKCYKGNCLDGSQNCSNNTNCGYVPNCSSGNEVSCKDYDIYPPGSNACRQNPVKPPSGYSWKADCSNGKSCNTNADCPQNSSLTGDYLKNSNWCFEFDEGKRCLQLTTGVSTSIPDTGPVTTTVDGNKVPFFGMLMGDDRNESLKELTQQARRITFEMNELTGNLDGLTKKTSDPLVKSLVTKAKNGIGTTTVDINSCLK